MGYSTVYCFDEEPLLIPLLIIKKPPTKSAKWWQSGPGAMPLSSRGRIPLSALQSHFLEGSNQALNVEFSTQTKDTGTKILLWNNFRQKGFDKIWRWFQTCKNSLRASYREAQSPGCGAVLCLPSTVSVSPPKPRATQGWLLVLNVLMGFWNFYQ